MSENAEHENNEINDVIESVFGGDEKSHSQETVNNENDGIVTDGNNDNAPEASKKADDSAEKEVPDVDALKAEIQNLNKRLHDTQSAMHNATEERSRLKRELEELKSKKDDEDDWFSEEDKAKSESLEDDLKKSDNEISQLGKEEASIKEKAAEAIWDAAAANVIAEHPDFEEVVYGKLAPLIDENSTDPKAKTVRELYLALPDKSPAAAYKFAKELDDRVLMHNDIEAYKQKVRSEIEREISGGNNTVEGKEGLDLLNSADSANYDYSNTSMDVLDFLPK